MLQVAPGGEMKEKKKQIKKREKVLSVRQQRYKQNRLMGMSKYAAARAAGYSHGTATQVKTAIEKHIDMTTAFEMAGLTDKALAEHAAQGMRATKTVPLGEGESTEVDDWGARHKYFESVLKVRGDLRPQEVTKNENHLHLTFQQLTKEVASARAERSRIVPSDDVPESGFVLSESVKRGALGQTSRDHGSGSGSSEGNGKVS